MNRQSFSTGVFGLGRVRIASAYLYSVHIGRAVSLISSKWPCRRLIMIIERFHAVKPAVKPIDRIGEEMSNAAVHPHLIEKGVYFKVAAGFVERDCIISKNALVYLGQLKGDVSDFMETYSFFEESIHKVARRLVVAGESASPLVLGAAYFVGMPAPLTS
jgi:hypothetical protein